MSGNLYNAPTERNLFWTESFDRMYLLGGYAAGACIISIFVITILQVASRAIGYNINGLTDIAGYMMAGAAFLGLAHTLNAGAHVRIELFLSMFGKAGKSIEKTGFIASIASATWFSWYCWSSVYWSYTLGDISQGMDATPIWIPQLSMALGATLFAISLIDHGLRFFLTGDHQIRSVGDVL